MSGPFHQHFKNPTIHEEEKMEMKMSVLSILFLVFLFQLSSLGVSQLDSCNSNLNLNSDDVPFNTTSLHCNPVWSAHGFILRYARSGPSLWSFVLSAPDPNSFVAMGFSKNGQMIGSSAIVGWISTNGTPVVKQYFLKGNTESQVLPDQGDLPLINGSTVMISQSSRLYIIFQLNTVQPQSKVIYSIGPSNVVPLSNGILTKHQDKVSTHLNYVTGQSSLDTPYTTLRRSHGILNMVGWGILMPIGAIFARYFREWDPYWFYAHVFIQAVGFASGLSGVIAGFSLNDKLSVNVDTHKALGIFILALGCLQLTAFLVRPDKGSKIRKYWNWYHSCVGRALIGIAIGNVFYGISLGGEGKSWNIGYGVVLGCWVLIALALEVRMHLRKK